MLAVLLHRLYAFTYIGSPVYYAFYMTWVIKSRRMRWAGHVARMEEGRGFYRVLIGRPEGKRTLGKPRRRWEDNIKIDRRGFAIFGANWIQPAQYRVQWRTFVNTVMNLWVS
jgi:hypothetical protein